MFSHAFEDVGKKLNLPMAIHENVSDALIRDDEIREVLTVLGRSFSEEVTDVIKNKKTGNLFDSVVSSQFDADRLDYMQRDRMMTGVQGSGVDATWILANLEVGSVPTGADEESTGEVKTLVLGPKAFYAAEHYVLSLFQLYPNVYLHKATRGAEKIFSTLIVTLFNLISNGHGGKTGLPDNHPIYLFLSDPESLEKALALDDAVFWGALPLMRDAHDPLVAEYAERLQERRLLKCIDVRRHIEGNDSIRQDMTLDERKEYGAKVSLKVKSVMNSIQDLAENRKNNSRRILTDEYRRSPYKRFQNSQAYLNQILIRQGDAILDMAHLSSVVSATSSFEVNRVYLSEDDADGRSAIESLLKN